MMYVKQNSSFDDNSYGGYGGCGDNTVEKDNGVSDVW